MDPEYVIVKQKEINMRCYDFTGLFAWYFDVFLYDVCYFLGRVLSSIKLRVHTLSGLDFKECDVDGWQANRKNLP